MPPHEQAQTFAMAAQGRAQARMTRKPPKVRMHAPRLAREQRVDEILVAARDVFCEKGYEGTAVAEIAERLGIVEGTIYKYLRA